MIRVPLLLQLISSAAAAEPRFCGESPIPANPASLGRPSRGSLLGAVRLEADAPPHDDHLHLRIACEPDEIRCRD